MTTLGLGQADGPGVDVKAGFRTGWLRHIGVAIGGASGAAAVLGGFEVLKQEPTQAFALLDKWGPGFLLVLVGLFVVGKLLDGLQISVEKSSTLMAAALTTSAEANGRTADALTRLAEQGGKQFEEVRRLSMYAAQEIGGVYERFDRQDAVLSELAASVKGLHTKLSNEKAALDKKSEGTP